MGQLKSRKLRNVERKLGLPANSSVLTVAYSICDSKGKPRKLNKGEAWELINTVYHNGVKAPQAKQKRPQECRNFGAPHPDYTNDGTFYDSREWKELRYLALRNTDGRCQCCGASSKDGVRIHVDHIQPRYKRPDLQLCLDNLQVLCEDCNFGKGAWDSTDWRG